MSKYSFALIAVMHMRHALGAGWFGQQQDAPASHPTPVTSDFAGLSAQASDFVGGCIDAFLGESEVSASERTCLSNGARQVTSSLSVAWDQAWQTYTQFQNQAAAVVFTSQSGSKVGFSSPYAGSQLASSASPVVTPGEAAVLAMEFAASLSSLYKVQSDVAQSCLRGDVVDEFIKAAKHLGNMTYVGGRLVSNGVDIVDELSAAFTSYEHNNFRAFGKDMGTACRKMLLSKRSDAGSFTFIPDTSAIADVTEGLLASLFGRGVGVQLITDAVPAQLQNVPVRSAATDTTTFLPWRFTPSSADSSSANNPFAPALEDLTTVAPTEYPATTLNVDLHECVVGNIPLLKSAWEPVFQLLGSAKQTSTAPSIGDLMLSMMDLQLALTRCNIGPDEEAMLIDALHSGTNIQTKLDMPHNHISGSRVSSLFASALEDFRNKHWYAFGSQLGAAMRDMVVVSFSEKYEVDDTGRLRLKIISAAEVGPFSKARHGAFGVACLCSLALGSFALVSAVMVVRRRRDAWADAQACLIHEVDCDLEAVE